MDSGNFCVFLGRGKPATLFLSILKKTSFCECVTFRNYSAVLQVAQTFEPLSLSPPGDKFQSDNDEILQNVAAATSSLFHGFVLACCVVQRRPRLVSVRRPSSRPV